MNGKKWNRKGYDTNNIIIYEINNGKGYFKELDECGSLKFEWEYLYGERNGKGKEYFRDNILEFEGY